MTKILVTGGCGFIGKNLCWFLHDKGIETTAMDNFSVGNPHDLPESTIVVEGDITNIQDCFDQVGKHDYVVNLAGLSGVQDSYEQAAAYWSVNLVGAINILNCCTECMTDKVVVASSGAAGDGESPYASSKWALEYVCQDHHANAVVLRFSNVYGPYSEHKTSLIHALLKAARDNKTFVLYGDGSHSRDFVYVNDVCNAIWLALNSKKTDKHPYEIGTGISTKVSNIIDLVKKITNQNINITQAEAIQEKDYNVAKTLMASEHIGFNAEIDLAKGIRQTWQSMQKIPVA